MELRKDDLFILLGLLVVVGGLMVGATTSKVFVNTNFGGNNISNISWVNASYSGSNSTWQHQTYPAACSDGYSITALGDSTTCTKFANSAPNLTEKNIEDRGFNIDAFKNSGVSNEGLVLEMPFDSSNYVNSSLTLDSSSQQNDGIVTGATFNSSGGIDSSGDYSFDGVNDYIQLPANTISESTLPNDFTWSLWFKKAQDSFGTVRGLLTAFTSAGGYGCVLYFSNEKVKGRCYNTTSSYTLPSTISTVVDTNWHNVVFVLTKGDVSKLYLDGVSQNDGIVFNGDVKWPASGESRIGAYRYDNTANLFNGSIDEVKIYNRSLSATEIQGLYEQRVKGRDSFGYRAKDNVWYGSQTIQQTETICLNGGACTQNISTNSTHTILCGLTTCTGIA